MISFALATALAAAAQGGSTPIPIARKQYSACLTNFVRERLQAKEDPAAFEAAVKAACADKKVALISALVADDRKRGAKPATAQKGAQEQIDDYLLTTSEDYKIYHADGTMPDPR